MRPVKIATGLVIMVLCFAFGAFCGVLLWLCTMPHEDQRSFSQQSKAARDLTTFVGQSWDDLAAGISLFGNEHFARMMTLRAGVGLFLVKSTSRKEIDLTTPREQGTQHFLDLINAISAENKRLVEGDGDQPNGAASLRIADVVIAYCCSNANNTGSKNDYAAFSGTWNAESIARLYGIEGDFRDPSTGTIRVDALIPITIRLPTDGIYPDPNNMNAIVTIAYIADKNTKDACDVDIKRHAIKLTYDLSKDDWVLAPRHDE